ncbi:hypothetical protein GCM10029963_77400 [Micromonospora andamanensis]
MTAVRIVDSSPPGWLDRRRRLLWDLLLWAVVAAPIGFAGFSPPYSEYALPLVVGKLVLLGVAVLLTRRRAPLAALVLVVLGSVVDGNFVFAIPVFSYLAGRRSASAVPAAGVFALIAAGAPCSTWACSAPGRPPGSYSPRYFSSPRCFPGWSGGTGVSSRSWPTPVGGTWRL